MKRLPLVGVESSESAGPRSLDRRVVGRRALRDEIGIGLGEGVTAAFEQRAVPTLALTRRLGIALPGEA
jgi:hypothetical protein